VAAGLLLVAAVPFGRAGDGLAVGDLRRVEDDLDARLPLHPRDRDLDVQLPRAGQQELVRVGVAGELQGGILLDELVDGRRDLVFVPFRLRLDRKRDRRLGEFGGREHVGPVLGRQRVSGQRLLQLRHAPDVARRNLRDGLLLLAERREEGSESLGDLAGRVPVGAVGFERTRHDPEEGQPSGEGSETVLKT